MLNLILKERAVYHQRMLKTAIAQLKAFPINSINHNIALANIAEAKAVIAELITIESMYTATKMFDK